MILLAFRIARLVSSIKISVRCIYEARDGEGSAPPEQTYQVYVKMLGAIAEFATGLTAAVTDLHWYIINCWGQVAQKAAAAVHDAEAAEAVAHAALKRANVVTSAARRVAEQVKTAKAAAVRAGEVAAEQAEQEEQAE